MRKRVLMAIAIVFAAASIYGCSGISPVLDADITPPPLKSTEVPSEAPPSASPEADLYSPHPFGSQAAGIDAAGRTIYDANNHYKQYLLIKSVRVYEENGGTFIDCIIENAYPEPIVCAVEAVFYDENDAQTASGSLQMGDGSFLLMLASGSNSLYAHILTDTVLTDMRVEFAFDSTIGVKPYQAPAATGS